MSGSSALFDFVSLELRRESDLMLSKLAWCYETMYDFKLKFDFLPATLKFVPATDNVSFVSSSIRVREACWHSLRRISKLCSDSVEYSCW